MSPGKIIRRARSAPRSDEQGRGNDRERHGEICACLDAVAVHVEQRHHADRDQQNRRRQPIQVGARLRSRGARPGRGAGAERAGGALGGGVLDSTSVALVSAESELVGCVPFRVSGGGDLSGTPR